MNALESLKAAVADLGSSISKELSAIELALSGVGSITGAVAALNAAKANTTPAIVAGIDRVIAMLTPIPTGNSRADDLTVQSAVRAIVDLQRAGDTSAATSAELGEVAETLSRISGVGGVTSGTSDADIADVVVSIQKLRGLVDDETALLAAGTVPAPPTPPATPADPDNVPRGTVNSNPTGAAPGISPSPFPPLDPASKPSNEGRRS